MAPARPGEPRAGTSPTTGTPAQGGILSYWDQRPGREEGGRAEGRPPWGRVTPRVCLVANRNQT